MSKLTPTAVLHGTIAISTGNDTLAEAMSVNGLAEYEFSGESYNGIKIDKLILKNMTAITDNMFLNAIFKEISAQNVVSIGSLAFKGSTIEKISAPNAVSVSDTAFGGARNIAEITIGASLPFARMSFDGAGILDSEKNKLDFDITGTSPLPQYCFRNAGVRNITIRGNFTGTSEALKGITVFGDLNIPDVEVFGSSELTFENAKFYGNVNIPKLKTATRTFNSSKFWQHRIVFEGLETLNGYTFANVNNGSGSGTGFVEVVLPKITSIGTYDFQNCKTLHDLYLPGETVCTLQGGAYAFYGSKLHEDSTARIHVPASLVESYKSASGWSSYANKIVAITEADNV